MNNIKMVYYDRIDNSEGFEVNKTRESKESDISHYWHFLNKGFKFQPNVCNWCYDLLMMSMNDRDIVILYIESVDYHSIISGISKSKAINLMQSIDLTQKSRTI